MEKIKNKRAKSALKNPWFLISVIAVIVIIVLAYKVMMPSTGTGKVIDNGIPQVAPRNIPSAQRDIPTEKVSVRVGDDAVLGKENAPVTIIEFSDYECPFCTRFYSNTLPQLKKEYIDTGKVKFIYRDFPLGFHANAQKAAEAAECAQEQEESKYWEMHDKLFEEGVSGGITAFKQYAKDLDLDEKKFDECLTTSKYRNEVLEDFQEGQEAGVQGTPTFFINGQKLVGAQPFEAFQQIIEQELNK